MYRLTEEFVSLLPCWPLSLLGSLLGDELGNVELADTSVQVHVVAADEGCALPELVNDVEQNNNRSGKVDFEEALNLLAGSHVSIPDGEASSPELCDQHETVKEETDPGADDAGLRLEGQLIKSVALSLPSLAESDVGEADTAPCEDGTETRKGQHPVESVGLLARTSKESEKSENGSNADGNYGTTLTVNVSENLGGLTLVGECGKSTRGTVNRGVSDRQNSNQNHSVHDRRKPIDAGVLDGNNEGTGLGISTTGAIDQTWIAGRNKKADEGKRDQIEEEDSPEDLLDGSRQRFARVLCFGGSKTDELSSGKGKGSSNEHTAETFETVVESSRV